MHTFDCRMYVSRRGDINLRVPSEFGPVKVARLRAIEFDELTDPGFRRLLAAFESIPQSLNIVRA